MAYYINNQATADKYIDANTVGPFGDADTATVLVSGAPVALQFFVGDASHGHWTDEREFIAAAGSGTTNSFKIANVHGVRARSSIPGVAATFSITLFRTGIVYDSADPVFEAGSLSPGTLTTSGTVNPGQSSVEVDHNGAKISVEPIFDLEDAGANVWTVTDDPANTRAKVAPVRMLTGLFRGNPAALLAGSGMTIARTAVGVYTVTFTVAFPAIPLIVAVPVSTGTSIAQAQVGNVQPGSCLVSTFQSNGVAVDDEFFIFAMGLS